MDPSAENDVWRKDYFSVAIKRKKYNLKKLAYFSLNLLKNCVMENLSWTKLKRKSYPFPDKK